MRHLHEFPLILNKIKDINKTPPITCFFLNEVTSQHVRVSQQDSTIGNKSVLQHLQQICVAVHSTSVLQLLVFHFFSQLIFFSFF